MGELTRKGQARPVTQEDLELYTQAQALQAQHYVPVLQHANNPHEYLFFALLDGTGQDARDTRKPLTNVGILWQQAEQLATDPGNRIGQHYVEGIGAQRNLLLRPLDGFLPFTWDEKIEEQYRAIANRSKEWKGHDPDAQIRIVHVGYSRGAVLSAGLTRLIDEYGIADPEGLKFGRDERGNITVISQRPPLVAPGQTAQAMALFDPVATNLPRNFDARPAPSVISAYSQLAFHERRESFPHQSILDAELSADARNLRAQIPGGHSNIGGGNRFPGLEALAFNSAVDYINALRDKPLFEYRPLPDDPALYTVYQVRGVTAVLGLDDDGKRDEREDLANCKIVDTCSDAEPMNQSLANQFEYRPLRPSAPLPALLQSQIALGAGAATATHGASREPDRSPAGVSGKGATSTPDHPGHPQHPLLQEIRGGVLECEREGAIRFRDDSERERFCRYALAACRDNRDELQAMYPNRATDAASCPVVARADHVVIGSKQYAFVVQGDVHDPAGVRVPFTMERARQTPVEQSDLKLARANEETVQRIDPVRQLESSPAIEAPAQRAALSR